MSISGLRRRFRFDLVMVMVMVLGVFLGGWSVLEAASRTNVILIMADDVGYECFGCYGSQQYQTPHIDRMAQQGMRFVHCYSQPLCTPSRIKLMTGLSNVRNYAAFSVLNPTEKTIGHRFQAAGYETLIAGKWQLLAAEHYSKQFRGKGSWPRKAGFDEVCLWQVDRLGSRFWQPLLFINGDNQQFAGADDYGPEIAARTIVDFIKRPHSRPFFIYYPMILVHNPFLPTPLSESRASKNKQKNFEDMVHYMDKIVGDIITAVDGAGLGEETLILFTGDNGTNKAIRSQLNGREIRGGKGQTTDAGTRVPLVARWSKTIPSGKVSEALIDFSDFLPTTLEAVGADIPTGIDGVSFLSQLKGAPGSSRKSVHIYYCPRPERTPDAQFVRDERWKLYRDGRLYDVLNDVAEKSPIDEADPQTQDIRRRLQIALDQFPDKGQMLLKFTRPEGRQRQP